MRTKHAIIATLMLCMGMGSSRDSWEHPIRWEMPDSANC